MSASIPPTSPASRSPSRRRHSASLRNSGQTGQTSGQTDGQISCLTTSGQTSRSGREWEWASTRTRRRSSATPRDNISNASSQNGSSENGGENGSSGNGENGDETSREGGGVERLVASMGRCLSRPTETPRPVFRSNNDMVRQHAAPTSWAK